LIFNANISSISAISWRAFLWPEYMKKPPG